jgi:hypothetical protein
MSDVLFFKFFSEQQKWKLLRKISELSGGRAKYSKQSAGKFLTAFLGAQDIPFPQLLDNRATQNIYNFCTTL